MSTAENDGTRPTIPTGDGFTCIGCTQTRPATSLASMEGAPPVCTHCAGE